VGGLAILCEDVSDTFCSYHLQLQCETKEGSGLIHSYHTGGGGGWSTAISVGKWPHCCQKGEARPLSLYLSSQLKP
jgi:hypothetical protein